jgi:DNA-binding CsgD family transcriptional regulator/tetratricopeptide (TPR) repeat protein
VVRTPGGTERTLKMVGTLCGREEELAVLIERLNAVGDFGGSELVEGEAGVGKSLLLSTVGAHASAKGFRVLRTSGVQAETNLPFAGLHQLIRPVLFATSDLPERQRDSLLAAFGLIDREAPDFFRIALAALEVLAESAARQPILILAEDLHWLDQPSSEVLAFIARRIEDEPIIMLLSIRTGYESAVRESGVPHMFLEGLAPEAASALLDDAFPDLKPDQRSRILTQAAGNPLALMELPRVGAGQLALSATLMPLTRRLEQAFAIRAFDLPPATRVALLVAALDERSDLAEVLEATNELLDSPILEDVLEPAVRSGLITIDDRLNFRHPLVRSAIYYENSQHSRRAAHAALANVLVYEPDRRVWHMAASVVGKNESVAIELEEAAYRARRRGAVAIAISAMDRAIQLSHDMGRAGMRSLVMAELCFEIGQQDDADTALAAAGTRILDRRQQAQLAWLRDLIVLHALDQRGIENLIDLARERSEDGDTDLALQLLFTASRRCYWADPGDRIRTDLMRVAESLDVNQDNPERLALFAQAAPIEMGRLLNDEFSKIDPQTIGDPAAVRVLGMAACAYGDFDMACRFLERSVAGLRSQGRVAFLTQALESQAHAALFADDWSLAARAAEEAVGLARETHRTRWLAGGLTTQALLAAFRGDRDLVTELTEEVQAILLPLSFNSNLALLVRARGLSALGLGLFSEAMEHYRSMFDPKDPSYHPFNRSWALADLAEAAAHTGSHDEARHQLDELREIGRKTPSPMLHLNIRFAEAVLAEDAKAESSFASALGYQAMLSRPFTRARLQLAWGEWLRRHQRVMEARGPLRLAREAFDALGALPWGERARQELRATGVASQRRGATPIDRLTPHELQIAHMVAEGLSNRQIAEQLYLSHRTVGAHLYRIFPKLGVTSRSQIRERLEKASKPDLAD